MKLIRIAIVCVLFVVSTFWVYPGQKPISAARAADIDASFTVSIGKLSLQTGDEFDVAIMLTANHPTVGAQVELNIDPNLIEITGITEGPFYKDWALAHGKSTVMLPANLSQANLKAGPPVLAVAIMGAKPGDGLIGSGVFATIRARVNPSARGEALFDLRKIIVLDAYETGKSLPMKKIKRQNAVVAIGQSTAPIQPALEDAPNDALPLLTKPTGPVATPAVALSPSARIAVDYLSRKSNLTGANLIVMNEQTITYENLKRQFQNIVLMDPRLDGKEYQLLVDPNTGDVIEDVASMTTAEGQARYARYGKLDQSLYERIQQLGDTDSIKVAIWLAAGPGQSLSERQAAAAAKIAGKYPAVKSALDRGDQPTAVSDPGLSRQIENEYIQLMDAPVADQIKPLMDALQSHGFSPATNPGLPLVWVTLTKKDLTWLVQIEDVGEIDLADNGQDQPALNNATGTDRIPTLWAQSLDGTGVKIAILERDNVDFNSISQYCPEGSHNCFQHPGAFQQGRDGIIYGNKSHATEVASVAASNHPQYRGIAPGATIISAGIQNNHNNNDQDDVDGLVWAINQGADIINASYMVCPGNNQIGVIDKIFDYYVRAYRRLLVVSSGNVETLCPYNFILSPGQGWNTFTVGAYADQNNTNWPDDSMWNSSDWVNTSNQGDHEKPEVVAPGVDMRMIGSGGNLRQPTSGTSIAAPQVSGLDALLIQKNPDLQRWPEAARAIIMASAVHNIDGPSNIPTGQDLKDGAGGIDGSLAATAAGFRNSSPTSPCTGSCWWGESIDNTNFPINSYLNRYFTATQGERIRAAISWDSNSDCINTTQCTFDRLDTDLNLSIFAPDGSVIPGAFSASHDNNYELVDFTAPQNGKYRIGVYKARADEPNNLLAIAVVKDTIYMDNLRNNVGGDGFVSGFAVKNIGSVAHSVKIHYLDTNGNPIYNSLPVPLDYDTCVLNPGDECQISVSSYNQIPPGTSGSAYVDGGEDLFAEDLFVRNTYASDINHLYIAGSTDIFPAAQISEFRYRNTSPGAILQVVSMDSDRGQQALLNGWADVAMSNTPCSTKNEIVPGSTNPSPYHCNQLTATHVVLESNKFYLYTRTQAGQNYANFMIGAEGQAIFKNLGFPPITVYAPDWDVNLDRNCNTLDVSTIGNNWGFTAPFSGNLGNPMDPLIAGWLRSDVNWDGVINVIDISTVGNNWGKKW